MAKYGAVKMEKDLILSLLLLSIVGVLSPRLAFAVAVLALTTISVVYS